MNKTQNSAVRIGIIGAGACGLTCAHLLADRGYRVTVFDKSRGVGGRAATRRVDGGMTFDHGVQYVTARGDDFNSFLRHAAQQGNLANWHPEVADRQRISDGDWAAGTPSMNSFLKPMTSMVELRLKTEITEVKRGGRGWQVRARSTSEEESFDVVVSTAPAPQARALLSTQTWVARAVGHVEIAPCWALLLAFPTRLNPGFDVWKSRQDTAAWVARDSSKPMRNVTPDCWTLHASPSWSERHLEMNTEDVAPMLLGQFVEVVGDNLPESLYLAAHRWRYARTVKPLGAAYLASEDGTLFVGGDWCLGARVESAFDSGMAIARAIVGE